MYGLNQYLLKLLFVIMLLCTAFYSAAADDDHHEKHRESRHEQHEHEEHHEDHLRPVDNQTYKDQCGACHFVYQPALLPSASWEKILADLEDHFGESVDLEDEAKKEILMYLKSNAAETSAAKRAVKIMQSLGNQVPIRITDIPYIRKKHMGIPPDFLNNKAIGSQANCAACHTTAESGLYDDDNVRIPR